MSAQRGKDLLLKLGSGGGFVTVAGAADEAAGVSIPRPVDATDIGNRPGDRRELGWAGAGVNRASVSGSEHLQGTRHPTARSGRSSLPGEIRGPFFPSLSFSLIFGSSPSPDFGVVVRAVPGHPPALEYTGNHNGEVSFDLALESAGQLTFEVA